MSRNDSYAGLCVGGPKDGQFVEHYAAKYPVIARDDFRSVEYVYRLKPFYVTEEAKAFNVWVCEDLNRDAIMQKLVDGYRKPKLGAGL